MSSLKIIAATGENFERNFDFIYKKLLDCNINKLCIKPLPSL